MSDTNIQCKFSGEEIENYGYIHHLIGEIQHEGVENVTFHLKSGESLPVLYRTIEFCSSFCLFTSSLYREIILPYENIEYIEKE